ncbi:outer membrane protein transport protein [Cocleimonas flava]|uniref:Long-chain fatty acid transport protein n=1 Tax=Cocleimonas flava TaxID=634765 RepID=A0A4R1FB56_9GAMM|nr:outer membrane protein transport protein [Cocleimonas flava]TCJ89188.1 long-chain fatty acid transport protein [Cocleimonas flava]
MPIKITLNKAVLFSTLPLLFASQTAYSAGFALIENSAAGMGKAFAGAAAAAEDASTVWFNPAGMDYLGKSLDGKSLVTQAGHIVSAKTKYTDKGSTAPAALNAQLGGVDENKRITSFIPNLYYVKPVNEKLHFGLGINGPFGSKTDYDKDWYGRYQSTLTDLLSININPALSWKASDKLSLGAGVSAQYVKLTSLSAAIDSAGFCRSAAIQTGNSDLFSGCNAVYPNAAQPETDSYNELTGDSIAFGYNLGLLYQPTDKTRLGLSYRSKVKHDVDGEVKFDLDPGLTAVSLNGVPQLQDRDVKASVELPDSLSFSVAHKVNDKLELLGDITWTGWSSFQELKVTEVDGVTEVSTTPEEWEDVYRISVGANYKYNEKLTLRTGVAYDEEPIPSAELRTPRIPGNDRTWISFGAGYKWSKNLDLDFGYSHLFLKETAIDNPGENGYAVRGTYKSSVDILSAQLNYKF